MAEPQVYLEKLSLFSRMLRKEGLLVSPQETTDGAAMLADLGFADREQVKTALRTVYAKSRDEQRTFDRVFDGFFLSEEAMKAQAKKRMEEEEAMRQAQQQAREDLSFNGQSMNLSQEQRDAYARMSREQKQKLQDIKEKYQENSQRNPNLYGNFIHSVFAKAILEQQLLMENAGVGVDEADPEMGLIYRDISQFKDTEIPRAITIIQDIAQRINGELSAQRKRAGRSGKLNFRKTIRKGLETGGSFYRLSYRKKRQRKRHLILLCDVSGSMMQFSEFALRFIQLMNQNSESSRAFLFSESLFEADAFHLQNMDQFRGYVRDSGVYGRGTDLGQALEQLNHMSPAALNDATTLLILSDTKTINQPRAVAALRESRRLAGRILWLNPIPQSKWQFIRSVQVFSSLCTMVSCSTLRELAAACKRIAES